MIDLLTTQTGGVFSLIVTITIILDFVIAFTIIFLERKDPSATLVWLFVLFIFPYGGIILYFLLSQNISKQKVYRFSDREIKLAGKSLNDQIRDMKEGRFTFPRIGSQWKELISLNQVYGGAYYTRDNDVKVITDGNELRDSMLADIRNAKRSIDMEFFIIKNDYVGRELINVLTAKAASGVRVRLLLDAVGSRGIWESTLSNFKEAGGEYAFFFRNRLRVINLRLNYRNHRKITVIDGKIGYIGGFNVGKEYLGRKKRFGYWRDTHLRIMGSSLNDLLVRFLTDWRSASGEELDLSETLYSIQQHAGETGVQIVSSGPNSEHQEIKRGYMKIITSARRNVYIQTPYFVPDASIMESLKMAAQSGVDVRLMIPCKPDHPFVYWATLSNAGDLVKSGGRVFIYENGFIHSKSIVADGEVASVGSTNFDLRSFNLNFESNAFLFDTKVARSLETAFEEDMKLSREYTITEYKNRSLWIRFCESISRLLSGIL